MSQATTWGAPRVADAPVTPEDCFDRVDISFDALLSSHSGAAIPAYAVEGTVWYDTDDDMLRFYDGSASFRLVQMRDSVPATAASTGKAGQIAFDGSYIYVCTATDTWVRAAVATW